MGRRRRGPDKDAAADADAADGPVAGTYPIDTGTAELLPDPYRDGAWQLLVNGVLSSHWVPGKPAELDFEYMRWIAALLRDRFDDVSSGAGAGAPLRLLHLGGAGCSLARWANAVYPASRQVVVEIDAALAALVRRWFDLPRAPMLRLRVGEARAVTESLTPGTRDVVIRDVFAGAVTPGPLTTVEFTRAVDAVLDDSPGHGGVYVANCGDRPDLALARGEAATIAAVFEHTVAIADPPMFKGRRWGNIIFAGSHAPLEPSPALRRSLLTDAVPAQVWDDAQVRRFAAGSRPRVD
ncbi:spermidine synthase [Tersicoccus phoenicis]|uniref:Spermidine synthase n=1 Tax=Tersicoccus phoenicis TaxID=554083 RepID=A0A1R1L7X8_9MICC|nr:fused MFS/spermidine synthase [Tersicoccus phoenicis]OMH23636.1 spermidine synthase [Tersicoccus phoenicis]